MLSLLLTSSIIAAQAEQVVPTFDRRPVPGDDLSPYNLYCVAGEKVLVEQERLVASPKDTEVLECGLRAKTRCAWVVTVVNRGGNERAPARHNRPSRHFDITRGDFVRLDCLVIANDLSYEPWNDEFPDQ